jgi:hypothetical protein
MEKSEVKEEKEVYEKPEVEVIEFDSNEIMVLSSGVNDEIYGI